MHEITLKRFKYCHCPVTGEKTSENRYYELFQRYFPKFKSVNHLNICNYHINATFILQCVILKCTKINKLRLKNIRISNSCLILDVTEFAMAYCGYARHK